VKYKENFYLIQVMKQLLGNSTVYINVKKQATV